MKKVILGLYISLISFVVVLFLQILYYCAVLPDNFYHKGNVREDFKVGAYPAVSAEMRVKGNNKAVAALSEGAARSPARQKMTLMLYGIIPIKDVTVSNAEEPMLIPSGEPFGLKILTDGVMVTDFGSVEGETGPHSPAKEAGIKEGDVIVFANGIKISSGNQLTRAVQLDGAETKLRVIREGQELDIALTPEKSISDGLYKLGIWTRDSVAGIGTLTYYDPKNGSYGGLGHSVCDADTGGLLPLSYGETVPVCINSVVKGVNGSPGELCGSFMSSSANGSILFNTECGVFGECGAIPEREAVPMAFKQEIEIGEAEIYTTIKGMTPKSYKIMIEKVNYNSSSLAKNMVIRITDDELLSETGGIVQGMSGSPIIQNGKLVGAVTHVFVNDITRGYGIFAENMYNVSSSINGEEAEYEHMENAA